MAFTGTWPGAVGEIRRATAAGGGTSLTTTPTFVEVPDGSAYINILARNLVTAVVMKIAKCPYLLVLKATDQLATRANTTDYSQAVQDPSLATSANLSNLGTAAQQDFLYVGAAQPFRGVAITNLPNANANASVLTVRYWNGTAWTATTWSDGTAVGGKSLAQTGNVQGPVPSDWKTATLAALEGAGAVPYAGQQGVYWTRWEWSAALSATVNIGVMLGMNRNSNYAEIVASSGGLPEFADTIRKGFGGIGGYEALVDAGTGNFEATVASVAGYGFATNA